MFNWNNAYKFIMNIKRDYVKTFKRFDTYSVEEMCLALNKPQYIEFLSNVSITVFHEFNLFKYNITCEDIKLPHSMYREMRSLVVDMKRDEIVLCPFRKFFNIGELDETQLSVVESKIKRAHNVEITNKLDGSMQNVRWYYNWFIMSGSQALDKKMSFRLAEGWEWFNRDENYRNMVKNSPDVTFSFEYISHKDIHVVQYKDNQQGLYLVGARNVYTGEQYPYARLKQLADKYSVLITEIDSENFETVLKSIGTYNALEKEGWVINIDGNLFKLKCDDYVKMHKVIMTNNSPNVILDSIRNDTYDDIISKVPVLLRSNIVKIHDNIMKYYNYQMKIIMEYYNQISTCETDKEFALKSQEIVPKEYQKYMFVLRHHKKLDILKGVKYYQIEKFLT